MADMKQTIEDLHRAAAAIDDAAGMAGTAVSGQDESKQQSSKSAAKKDEKPELN